MSENTKETKSHIKQKPSGALSGNEDYRKALVYQDEFAITNTDPDRHYRFISRAVLEKSGGFDRRGWEPITAANSKGEALVYMWGHSSQSGTDVKNGDLILAYMPKERMVRKQEVLAKRQNLMRSSLQRLSSQRGHGVESMDFVMQRQGKTEQFGF